jgi:hypothetical protein
MPSVKDESRMKMKTTSKHINQKSIEKIGGEIRKRTLGGFGIVKRNLTSKQNEPFIRRILQ